MNVSCVNAPTMVPVWNTSYTMAIIIIARCVNPTAKQGTTRVRTNGTIMVLEYTCHMYGNTYTCTDSTIPYMVWYHWYVHVYHGIAVASTRAMVVLVYVRTYVRTLVPGSVRRTTIDATRPWDRGSVPLGRTNELEYQVHAHVPGSRE